MGGSSSAQVALAPEASGPSAEPVEYRAAIDLAVAEYELSNFAEARAQFQKAHALYPNARSFRGLGMTEFELRNYGDAIAHLEHALASPIKQLTGTLREQTVDLLTRARGYVARLHLELDPQSATLVVDGTEVQRGATDLLLLEVGDHVIELHAPGKLSERRPVKVTGGEERTLRWVLRPAVEPHTERRWYKSPWLWTAVGVLAAGAATGAALAHNDKEAAATAPEGGTTGISLTGPRRTP
jgi:tetratricopeptide (TPR) repeat protein